MHPALEIPELRRNVCENATKGSNITLARTCKFFLEPALDCVWAEGPTYLKALLRCLPPDAWEEEVIIVSTIPLTTRPGFLVRRGSL